MKKILLTYIFFLFNLNLYADSQIWECITYMDKEEKFPKRTSVTKIDTNIPIVYHRTNGEWKSVNDIFSGGVNLIYDKSNDNITVFPNNYGSKNKGDYIVHTPYMVRYDLVLKKVFWTAKSGKYLAHRTCKNLTSK